MAPSLDKAGEFSAQKHLKGSSHPYPDREGKMLFPPNSWSKGPWGPTSSSAWTSAPSFCWWSWKLIFTKDLRRKTQKLESFNSTDWSKFGSSDQQDKGKHCWFDKLFWDKGQNFRAILLLEIFQVHFSDLSIYIYIQYITVYIYNYIDSIYIYAMCFHSLPFFFPGPVLSSRRISPLGTFYPRRR